MNEKLRALFASLQPGETVDNPVKVTQWTNAVMVLIGIITAILTLIHQFGVDYNLTSDQITTISGCLVTIVTLARTLISKMTNPAPALPSALKPTKEEEPLDEHTEVVLPPDEKAKWKRDKLIP